MKYVVALDIGGTKTVAALLRNNTILKKIKVKTRAEKGKGFVIRQIFGLISLLVEGVDKKDIKGIGIGMPGPLNPATGIIYFTPNMPGWKNVHLKRIIEKRFRIKTRIDNDANCAALGESIYFACDNLICLTLGTGVGGGIIINNSVYQGEGFAGELGHMVIQSDGPRCNCGNHGCLEEFVSERGIKKISKKILNERFDPKVIQLMAEKGDKKALKVYWETGRWLGIGLANLANIFNPKMIVISGGISKARNLILISAVKEMKKRAFKTSTQNLKVVISDLGSDASLIGAANLF